MASREGGIVISALVGECEAGRGVCDLGRDKEMHYLDDDIIYCNQSPHHLIAQQACECRMSVHQ